MKLYNSIFFNCLLSGWWRIGFLSKRLLRESAELLDRLERRLNVRELGRSVLFSQCIGRRHHCAWFRTWLSTNNNPTNDARLIRSITTRYWARWIDCNHSRPIALCQCVAEWCESENNRNKHKIEISINSVVQ